jgi:hypothetical protein
MGNQKFGSKSRNHATNPANFLEVLVLYLKRP